MYRYVIRRVSLVSSILEEANSWAGLREEQLATWRPHWRYWEDVRIAGELRGWSPDWSLWLETARIAGDW